MLISGNPKIYGPVFCFLMIARKKLNREIGSVFYKKSRRFCDH